MAAAAPSRPFLLLEERATYCEYSDRGMVECECETKVAYGCGPLGQQIVEGLTLLADLPRLAVHATDEVLHLFNEEVPGELAKIYGSDRRTDLMLAMYGSKVVLSADVDTMDDDGGVVVVRVTFFHDGKHHHCRPHLGSYHLVYDREASSLSLLPFIPFSPTESHSHCRTVYDSGALLVRGHGVGGYSLVLTAVVAEEHAGNEAGRPILCFWKPTSPPSDGGVGPWRIRQRRNAMAIPDRFGAQAFTYKGKAFWACFNQGILYCDIAELLKDDGGDDPVDFTFVPLPEENRIEKRMDRLRTMRNGVGDSVWFVFIEPSDHPGDTIVTVLSLDLSDDGAGERRWKRHLELSLMSIWALEGFVEAGLPRTVPWSLFLTEQDAGVLYFLLPPADTKSDQGCYLVGIDVRDSSLPRLLPPRRLAIYPIFSDQPLLLAPEFLHRRRNQEEALS